MFGESERVRKAIQELFSEGYTRQNCRKVWACLDPRLLVSFAGHYLKYGPEYIQAIAAKLGRKDELRSVGIPTLIGFDIEVRDMPEADLHLVVRTAVAALFDHWRGAQHLDVPLNFGLSFRSPISSSQIREITHSEPTGNYGY